MSLRFSAFPVLLVVGLAAIAASGVGTLHAQDVVIYRCTDAKGALTFQNNVPCPKGAKQERRVVQPAQTATTPITTSAPRPVVTPITPVVKPDAEPATETPAPTIADADRLPPPPLFQCNTYDNDSYLSENSEPLPRCVQLQTTGIDGSEERGAGQACQMVTDQCQRVPDGAACEAWKKRLKEVEATWRFSRAADKEAQQVEFKRVAQMLRDSTCGK